MPSENLLTRVDGAGSFAIGEVVHVIGNRQVARAQADVPANVSGAIGLSLGWTVVFGGVSVVQLEAGLLPAPGQTLYISATQAGRATNVAPALVQPFASILDAARYAQDGTVICVLITDATGAGFPGFGGVPAAIDIGDVGSPGIAPTASRSDHEHPFSAPGAAPPAIAGVGAVGAATTPARSDHTHAGVHSVNGLLGDVIVPAFAGFGGVPPAVDIGDVGAAGIAPTASRSDHEHPFPAPGAAPPNIAAASAVGVATTPARSDHTHGYDSAALPTEILELLPIPEARVTGNATRVGQTVFDGASYFFRTRVTFNRIIFRVAGYTGGTLRLHIYQAPSGLSGSTAVAAAQPQRVATISAFDPGGTGNFEVALDGGGSVTLEPGLIYVLWGRDSAANSVTLQTYTTQNNSLLNTNVDTDTHPCSFTTAIAATTSPATFDPRQAPSGAATGTASDVVPIIRLRNV